jgi:hypothetical protein
MLAVEMNVDGAVVYIAGSIVCVREKTYFSYLAAKQFNFCLSICLINLYMNQSS